MTRIRRDAPPTDRQVAMFLALVEHRTMTATARAMGVEWSTADKAVEGFLRRARYMGRR